MFSITYIIHSIFTIMLITFEELRKIKHNLPTGSISKIAGQLDIPEQTVRNYFGAKKYEEGGEVVDLHVQPGPSGGVVKIENPAIIELARKMITESEVTS